MQTAQNLGVLRNFTTGENFRFWSLHRWKTKLMPEQKARWIEGRVTAEGSSFKAKILRRVYVTTRSSGSANPQST